MKVTTKNILTFTLFAVLVVAVVLSACITVNPTNAFAETVVVKGEGDTFVMTEVEKDADTKFVFTATANFASGNAAALVFGKTDDGCWVFNVDRADNRVKLMYFDAENKAHVLKEEFYVGTNAMNDGEINYVKTRTSTIDKVYLKVAVTPNGNGSVQLQCYADGIQRFAYTNGSQEAQVLDLNALSYTVDEETVDLQYTGGLLGYNCYNADVSFTDQIVGTDDYSYYTELYRNQYHFSQFAHWNNDPNGMVYYNGYYHVYFQHNPYGNTWDAMHWGHARSTDLVHWELLPIALVPDYDLPEHGEKTLGAMWSGSAMVYHKGDSATIDGYNWFDAEGKQVGDELGLIGYYSWFGDGGNRYQILMYSDDGGLSWHKRNNIPCHVSLDLNGNPVQGGSWRDPKVFDISNLDGVGDYKWGMALTNMEQNVFYFLKSKDLVSWEHAGSYEMLRPDEADKKYIIGPECPDVVFINDGQKNRTVITLSSRFYVVCDLGFENGNIVMKDSNGNTFTKVVLPNKVAGVGEINAKYMEYGVDSYASQTFYIDANSDSPYAGKSVSMSWFSGVPNVANSIESGALAAARKVWNGGGFTIPVIYGLQGETLTTTPVTVDDVNFQQIKTNLLDVEANTTTDGNLLANVKGHQLEIIAKLENTQCTPVSIKVNVSADGKHYTEIGWNQTEGYFVDRTHTEDAGLVLTHPGYNNYAQRYASYQGLENTRLDFYILVDNNNVEVYCDGYTVPFYVLTFASPYSMGTSLTASSIVQQLTVNAFDTVWRGDYSETMINLSETSVNMDLVLSDTKEIFAVSDGNLQWEVVEGQDVVQVTPNSTGAQLRALKGGTAVVKVSCGEITRNVEVTVHGASALEGLTLDKDGIIAGDWYYTDEGLVGSQMGGDGYVVSKDQASDFLFVSQFDLGSGAAAAVVFRATVADGSLEQYLIANYDRPGNIVKLWSNNGEIARAAASPRDTSNMTLSVYAQGRRVQVFLDGNKVIDVEIGENDPLAGVYGLNVCATTATFKSAKMVSLSANYSDNLVVGLGTEQIVNSVVNLTLGNTKVNPLYYTVNGETLTIDSSYFATLPATGNYEFAINGNKFAFVIKVNVDTLPQIQPDDMTVEVGNNVVVFVGGAKIDSVKVNGVQVDADKFAVKNNALTINASVFVEGQNDVELSNGSTFTVFVEDTIHEVVEPEQPQKDNIGLIIGLSVGGGVLVIGAAVLVLLLVLRKRR